jgi:hypothetical protein
MVIIRRFQKYFRVEIKYINYQYSINKTLFFFVLSKPGSNKKTSEKLVNFIDKSIKSFIEKLFE